MTCLVCHAEVAAANGIFVHAATGRPESLSPHWHYAKVRS